MNKYVLPNLINLLIITVFIIPLIYGLYVNDWDIQRYLGFEGPEVVIDVSTSIENVTAFNDIIGLAIKIDNIGNVPINLTSVQGILNISIDNRFMVLSEGLYVFKEPHKLDPGSSVIIEMEFPVRESPIDKIMLIRFNYKLDLIIESQVLGNTIPFTKNLSGEVNL